jgi:hypothetical protein
MKRSRVLIGIAAIIVMASVVALTPYWTVYRMRQAIDAKDAVTLADYIDFPAVRENFRGHIGAVMAKHLADEKGGGQSALMLGLTGLMQASVNALIDSMITPESLAAMMAGSQQPKDLGAVMVGVTEREKLYVQMKYETFDRFVVAYAEAPEARAQVVYLFTRSGLLGWKLSGFRLPV